MATATAKRYSVTSVPVTQIRKGQRIASRIFRDKVTDIPYSSTQGEEVKHLGECGSQWRTHVHVNAGCYDTRVGRVWLVGEPIKP